MKAFTAVILSGGKSRRMGQKKAALKLGTDSFLERIANEFSDIPVFVSVGQTTDNSGVFYPALQDIYPNCGPLGGIYTALSSCATNLLFVVPCDLPLFQRAFAEQLLRILSRRRTLDAVIPKTPDGFVHPTCAAYRTSCLPVLKRNLEKGNFKLKQSLDQLSVCYLEEISTEFQRALKYNINTPEEYARLLKTSSTEAAYAPLPKTSSTEAAYAPLPKNNPTEKEPKK